MANQTRAATARSELELLTAQLGAIDAWHEAHQLHEGAAGQSAQAIAVSRDMGLDLSRRRRADRREHAAIVARADEQLLACADVLRPRPAVRAVVAHRSAWMAGKIATGLQAQGVHVVGIFDDGADAAGTVVAEQPDLVLVEDLLPTLTGLEVVRSVSEYSPATVIGVQTLDNAGVAALVGAGAHAVFSRRIPPADVVEQLMACLADFGGRSRPLTVL